jgi:hypothetical protein
MADLLSLIKLAISYFASKQRVQAAEMPGGCDQFSRCWKAQPPKALACDGSAYCRILGVVR